MEGHRFIPNQPRDNLSSLCWFYLTWGLLLVRHAAGVQETSWANDEPLQVAPFQCVGVMALL